ncbi:hypothetical protein NEAUS04_2294, partial [Nematocida ausubeli]
RACHSLSRTRTARVLSPAPPLSAHSLSPVPVCFCLSYLFLYISLLSSGCTRSHLVHTLCCPCSLFLRSPGPPCCFCFFRPLFSPLFPVHTPSIKEHQSHGLSFFVFLLPCPLPLAHTLICSSTCALSPLSLLSPVCAVIKCPAFLFSSVFLCFSPIICLDFPAFC